MTYLPICQHRDTKPVRLSGCGYISRCECGAEFAQVGGDGRTPDTMRRRTKREQARIDRLKNARARLFGTPKVGYGK